MRTIVYAARYFAIAAVVFSCATSFADEKQAKDPAEDVINSFVDSVKNSKDFTDGQRQEMLAMVKELRQDSDQLTNLITEVFISSNSDFEKALEHLGEEEAEQAIKLLAGLQKSKNSFFATEAKYYTARAYLMDENYEKAESLLKELTSKLSATSLHTGDSLYHLGIAQAHLLKRKEALASLTKFRNDHAKTASERQLVSAFRQIEELNFLEKGSLVDVQDRMDYSRRRLALKESGQRTRGEQDNIIAMLDVLIKEAEKKEGS